MEFDSPKSRLSPLNSRVSKYDEYLSGTCDSGRNNDEYDYRKFEEDLKCQAFDEAFRSFCSFHKRSNVRFEDVRGSLKLILEVFGGKWNGMWGVRSGLLEFLIIVSGSHAVAEFLVEKGLAKEIFTSIFDASEIEPMLCLLAALTRCASVRSTVFRYFSIVQVVGIVSRPLSHRAKREVIQIAYHYSQQPTIEDYFMRPLFCLISICLREFQLNQPQSLRALMNLCKKRYFELFSEFAIVEYCSALLESRSSMTVENALQLITNLIIQGYDAFPVLHFARVVRLLRVTNSRVQYEAISLCEVLMSKAEIWKNDGFSDAVINLVINGCYRCRKVAVRCLFALWDIWALPLEDILVQSEDLRDAICNIFREDCDKALDALVYALFMKMSASGEVEGSIDSEAKELTISEAVRYLGETDIFAH
jgi:hypothetical protein